MAKMEMREMVQKNGRGYWLWVIGPKYYLEDDGTDRESLDPEDNSLVIG